MAAQWADGIWPLFVLLGLERVEVSPGITRVTPLDFVSYPYTHSLLFALLWSVLFGGIYYFIKKNKRKSVLKGRVYQVLGFL